jgi:pimeloyl-ACP methyl ester carboxylesterase
MLLLMRCALLLLTATALAVTAPAAPCIDPMPACTEFVNLPGTPGQPARLLVYRSYPLETRNEAITRALVLIHGGGRDANNEFRTALAAAFLAGATENTILIAPRFAANTGANVATACRDSLAPGELNWVCDVQSPESWRAGGGATGAAELTSFDAADEILRTLARKSVFPNLKAIVVAGQSAGGMFVTRYEMTNRVHETLGVPVSYVVSNPNIYAYLDGLRPDPAAAAPEHFAPFADANNCTRFDDWPYGLRNRTGYSARLAEEQLRKQAASRPTTYLLGDLDVFPAPNWDPSCPAMAQGPTRLARGKSFGAYVNQNFGAQHKLVVVRFCGHNSRCMFTADLALPILFPKP